MSPKIDEHSTPVSRRFPIGAELQSQGGTHFRVWAPRWKRAELLLEPAKGTHAKPRVIELHRDTPGYFSRHVPEAAAGMLYRFRSSGDPMAFPDPASRFQPQGPHGPSQIVAADGFAWNDAGWKGPDRDNQVVYELHLGTFTAEGTYRAAVAELAELAHLGVTTIELMPIADFPGKFGWGYDGVNLFAPTRLYGTPDDLRRFVDEAHQVGLSVILDVVYNHFGPDGNYLKQFSEDYFTDRHRNDWGEAINFDGPNSAPVREFFLANAAYWIEEFHFDGLRLDATQQIHDSSPESILTQLVRTVRQAAEGRRTFVVAENEPQDVTLIRPAEQGGNGIDAIWNDDLHHSAMVRLTGRREAYFTDYLGTPQEFVSAAKRGFLYQGQHYRWQKQRRGTEATGVQAAQFVNFIQNHDQIANSLRGERLHQLSNPAELRAMTALILLMPGTPMLYQGQEFAASEPFLYFADHNPKLALLVAKGRAEFLAQFPSLSSPTIAKMFAGPADVETFQRCKLNFGERKIHAPIYRLHRDLLKLRQKEFVPLTRKNGNVDGAVLGSHSFLLRFFGEEDTARLLLVNFGSDLSLSPAPEPLLAPPAGYLWARRWSSEDPIYGGQGTPDSPTDEHWLIPAKSALVFAPRPVDKTP